MYEKSHILTQHLKNIHPLKQFSHWRNSKAIHGNNATVITDKTLPLYCQKHVLLLPISATWRSRKKCKLKYFM